MKRGRGEYKKSLVNQNMMVAILEKKIVQTKKTRTWVITVCVSDQGSADVDEVPDLTSDEEGRPMRNLCEPERYDPSTGRSYAQMEACHNIMKQSSEPKVTLDYTEEEVQVVANIITQLKAKCNAQQYMLKRGLQEVPIKGAPAAKEELTQMHERKCFKVIGVAELTRQKWVRAQEGIMILNKKQSGCIKGRLAYKGKAARE